MFRKFSFWLWVGTLSLSAHAGPRPFCQSSAVSKIQVPIYPSRSDSPTFEYSFQFIRGADPRSPTVIVIPGGPGGASINDWGTFLDTLFVLPSGGNTIFTDPRGIGCNDRPNISDDSISTENFAADIVAMVKSLGLKNYILYGHSYGSLLATVTASKAQAEGVPPLAIVISGIIGRALEPGRETLTDGMIGQWRLFKRGLAPAVTDLLTREPLPFGLDAKKWAAFLEEGLTEGTLYIQRKPVNRLGDRLLALQSADPAELDNLKAAVSSVAVGGNPKSPLWRVYRNIMCREITAESNGPQPDQLIGGELVRTPDPSFCAGLSLDHPFNAANFQITVPIFYFQGTDDANTPYWQARYHYDQQNSSKKFFTTVFGVAHGIPLGGLVDCKDQVWSSIFGSGRGLKAALAACPQAVGVEEGHGF